jgi:ubiquinone/menaquinone biosynthesis C-methylase UbiE
MITIVLVLLSLAAGIGVVYWLLILTEGAYLGPGVVAFLYDRGATTYDGVKKFDAVDDARFLALPLVRRLRGIERPLVLDVATGTGRLPLALLRNLEFEGTIVGLDISKGMLEEARRKAARYRDRVYWLWKDASDLPFADDCFDAVTCLEALEFVPEPGGALREMARVLRPGGTLLVTNRIGFDALVMPGRAFRKEDLRARLADLGLLSVEIERWQTYYDLVWARKEGSLPAGEPPRTMEEMLCCPGCGERSLSSESRRLVCENCGFSCQVKGDIIYAQDAGKGSRSGV